MSQTFIKFLRKTIRNARRSLREFLSQIRHVRFIHWFTWSLSSLAIAIFLSIGCGSGGKATKKPKISGSSNKKTSDDKKSKNSGFLAESDFKEAKNDVSKKDVTKQLMPIFNVLAMARSHIPWDKSVKSDVSSDCNSEMDDLKVSTKEKKIEVGPTNFECYTETEDIKVTWTFKYQAYFNCSKKDFPESYKKASKLTLHDLADDCPSATLFYLSNLSGTGTYKDGDEKVTLKLSQSTMKSDGTACSISTEKSEFTIDNSCSYYQKLDIKEGKKNVTLVYKGKYQSAGAKFSEDNLTKGSMDFTLNKWKGSLKFKGAQSSYKASNKDDEVDGTIDE